jgi:hypothetical protein
LNRNIVTPADVEARAGREAAVPGGAAQLSADDYLARLAKYVPVEMISAYLVVQGLIETAYKAGTPARAYALGGLLVISAIITWFFCARVLKVQRRLQLAMAVLALVTWVLAIGGWFATTSWWQAWFGTAAVVFYGVLARIVNLPPLPPDTAI